jgi:hypothetical protein
MSEGKEVIVAEHPKAWVVRMVEGRGLKVAEKTLYWWSVHLERFLKFCRSAGAESSEIPEVAARLFLESLPVGGSAHDFAREQARMALDVFIGEIVGWSWGEDRYGRVGPKFRLKANSAGLTTTERRGRREVEQPKVGPEGARRAGASESKDTERGCWPTIELMEWNRHGSRTDRRAIPTLGFRWALPRRGQSGTRRLWRRCV